MDECQHLDFDAYVAVNRLEDSGRFAADVRIECRDCRKPFVFKGLPPGVNLDGAAVSIDGTEARLAIAPQDEDAPPWLGATGFSIKGKVQ